MIETTGLVNVKTTNDNFYRPVKAH